jgi:hypothetical protein
VLSLSTPVQYELQEGRAAGVVDDNGGRDRECGGGPCSVAGAEGAAPGLLLSESADEGGGLPLPPRPAVMWRPGRVHLEKNWGESFPDEWIWAQGHKTDAGGQVGEVWVEAGQLTDQRG